MVERTLVAWIGRTDLKAAAGDPDSTPGPIGQAVQAEPYESIHLLSDFTAQEAEVFQKWLASKTIAGIDIHAVKLSSPIDFGEIYQHAVAVLDNIKQPREVQRTYHLSPGTPAMPSVWILLAKSTHAACLIQSSPQAGVQEACIPFDIAAEFIPHWMQQSDARLARISQGAAVEGAEFSHILHRSAAMKRVIERKTSITQGSWRVWVRAQSSSYIA